MRTEARDPNPETQRPASSGQQKGESMRPTAKTTGTVRLPEDQVQTIVKAVLASPFLEGYMRGRGIDPNEIERTVVRKLARFTLKKDVKAAAANVRTLERKLAKEGNPVVRAELSRRLAVAQLEAKVGAR